MKTDYWSALRVGNRSLEPLRIGWLVLVLIALASVFTLAETGESPGGDPAESARPALKLQFCLRAEQLIFDANPETEWRLVEAVARWGEFLGTNHGIDLDLFVGGEASPKSREEGSRIRLVVSSPIELTQPEGSASAWVPVFAIERSGGLPIELVGVTRAQNGEASSRARGKLILCDARDDSAQLSLRWFNREKFVRERGVLTDGEPPRLGASISSKRAIHSVFFGMAYGCIVRREAFDAAVARNPQLAEDLEILGGTKPVLGQVLFVDGGASPQEVSQIESAIGGMESSSPGRRVMKLLGWNGVRPLEGDLREAYENTLLEAGDESVPTKRATGARLVGEPADQEGGGGDR